MQRIVRFTGFFATMGMSLALLILAGAGWLAHPQAVYAQAPIYVDRDAPGPTYDGLSWTSAFTTLQDALDLANANGGTEYEIWVAEGVYYPDEGGSHVNNSRDEFFRLNWDNVQLYGGFGGYGISETLRTQRDWVAHPTILSGDIDGDDINTDGNFIAETWADLQGSNAWHVLYLDGTTNEQITAATVLDGFTVTGGTAVDTWTHYAGGGLYCAGSDSFGDGRACSPTLANVTFSGNLVAQNGGGMYNDGGNNGESSPTLTNVAFSGNQAANEGGGMYNFAQDGGVSSPTLTNVTFSGNQAITYHGGGMYNNGYAGTSRPMLVNVTFSDNQAGQVGGGMGNYASSPTLTDVTFSGNQAYFGGGMSNEGGATVSSSPTMTNVTFSSNTATLFGGGMYNSGGDGGSSPTLSDVTFSGNQASRGGGMYNWGEAGGASSPTLTDVTFRGNQAGRGGGVYNYGLGGASSPMLVNVLFSGNLATHDGGGMYNWATSGGASSPTLINVTFSGNRAYYDEGPGTFGGAMYNFGNGGVSSPTLINTILWGNHATYAGEQIYNNNAAPTLTYSLVEGGCPTGATCGDGMRYADPHFVDSVDAASAPTTDGNYRVYGDSPAVGAGSNLSVTVATDLDDRPRIANGVVDMGAYEIAILFVDKDRLDGAHTGLSWTDAFTTVQDALDVTNGNGGLVYEIWTAEGVYYPDEGSNHVDNDQDESFGIDWNNVQLYGGFGGYGISETVRTQRDWVAYPTILSGDIDGDDDNNDGNFIAETWADLQGANAWHVLNVNGSDNQNITAATVIDGFTITAGGAMDGSAPRHFGGGLYCIGRDAGDNVADECSPALANVVFSGNQAFFGGAMANFGDEGISSPTLTNIIFRGNQAITGGAMLNVAASGASSPILANVTFHGNRADFGGALANFGQLDGTSSPRLTNVLFSGNQASTNGGAMINSGDQGISNPTLTNVTFSSNRANMGGAMYNEGVNGGTSGPTLVNSILWGNTATTGTQIHNAAAAVLLAYSTVEGGCPADALCKAGMRYTDPGFLAPIDASSAPTTTGNYRLQSDSPAIDAGDNQIVTTATDRDSRPRIANGVVDMGAYEVGILYVDQDRLGGAHTGLSWTDAFTTVQDALTVAGSDVDRVYEIWVAEGVYTPGLAVEDSFSLPAGTALYGGFAGYGISETLRTQRNWTANVTVLSGDIGGDDTTDGHGVVHSPTDIVGDNAWHVLWVEGASGDITGTTRLDGFVVTAGSATDTDPNDDGGGLYCNAAVGLCNPTIANVIFSGNHAAGSGGGMYNNQSSPTLIDVAFVGNQANSGGGLFNSGSGGESSPTLTNVVFSGNQATNGGGMYNRGIEGGDSNPTLTNVTFGGNLATGRGGAIYNNSEPGGSSPLLTNTILWGNAAVTEGAQIHNSGGTPSLRYSLVEGGCPADSTCGDGMRYADAQFVAPIAAGSAPTGTGNYRLIVSSPAVDAGDNPSVTAPTDLDGAPRIQNGTVDMGAYETTPMPFLTLAKQVTPVSDVPYQGVVTYTIVLSNSGNLTDTATLTDTLPAQVTFGGWVANPGAVQADNAITWSGEITPATVLTFTFTAAHTHGAGTAISNMAFFSGSQQSGSAAAAFTALCSPAITVQNSADSGAGSLRQAIADLCPGGTIDFAAGMSGGAIALGSELPIGKDMTITSSVPITVSGGGAVRIFAVSAGVKATLAGLTLYNAYADSSGGGAIHSAGTLTVTNSVVYSSSAAGAGGAILIADGTLIVESSTLADNQAATSGGAIFLASGTTAIITNSSISGNAGANDGGGVHNNSAALVVAGSTFAGNQANQSGGGINNNRGTVTVQNSTLYTNNALYGGGIGNQGNSSLLRVTNSTFAGNGATGSGADIYNQGTMHFANTVLANAASGANCVQDGSYGAGIIATTLNNLVEDGTCSTGGVNFKTGDPLLGSLGDYGGATQTIPLLMGSTAIDAGDAATCLAADQRGVARPQGAACDIGAFESRGFTLTDGGGSDQHAAIGAAFAQPLTLTVASAYTEPVAGGQVVFTAPLSGASISPAVVTSTVGADGAVSATVTANQAVGSYVVSAGAHGILDSAAYTLTNDPGPTNTSLAGAPNPSVFGQPVTFTATVTVNPPGAGTPTGVVTFTAGATQLGVVNVAGSGIATVTTSSLAVGEQTITAAYGGDASFVGSSDTLTQTVDQANTTTALTTSRPISALFGQPVTFTATVTVDPPGAGTPTGVVTFTAGATQLGVVNLAGSGVVTVTTSGLAVGEQTITAAYGGNTSFVASSDTLTQTVDRAATTTALTTSHPISAVFGQPVVFTATVTVDPPGAGTPTGVVTFTAGATQLGVVNLAGSGVATVTTSSLAVGEHAIVATYGGDTSFVGSSDTLTQTVNQANTTTALASDPNPSVFGEPVVFTATVTVDPPGAGTPTGVVTFTAGASQLGVVNLAGSGMATVTTSGLAVGEHTITAAYGGNGSFLGSNDTLTQTVDQAATTTALASAPSPAVFGQPVIFTATVAVSNLGAGTPTGVVTFTTTTGDLSVANLGAGGVATVTTSSLAVGSHVITATYGGDAGFTASGDSLTQTVNQAATTTALASTSNPAVFGQPVIFTATVAVSNPGAGTPTGVVTFTTTTGDLSVANLGAGGVATVTTSSLAVGSHVITATYGGDANFIGSSDALTQTVNQAATTTALASTSNPAVFGQPVIFTATVAVTAPGAGTPTGVVTFTTTTGDLSVANLGAGGVATVTTTSLAAGSHVITATYGGDANLIGSSDALTQTITRFGAAVAVVSAPNPSAYGQNAIFTVTVTAMATTAFTPTGAVTLTVGGADYLLPLNEGVTTRAFSELVPGIYTATASYGGDAIFAASTSSPYVHVVAKSAVTTTVTPTPNPATYGEDVNVSVSVTALYILPAREFGANKTGGLLAPTGVVTLYDGVELITSDLLVEGLALLYLPLPAGGVHTLTVQYGGDDRYVPGQAAAPLLVNPVPTASTLTGPPAPTVYGQPAVFSATVTAVLLQPEGARPQPALPGGQVHFFEGPTLLGSGALIDGATHFTTSVWSGGVHTLTALYLGDSNNLTSTATTTHTVQPLAPVVSLTAAPNPSLYQQAVTFTATMPAPGAGLAAPAGQVSFQTGATVLGVTALTNGVATLTNAALPGGDHAITALYGGDGNYQTAVSDVLTQTVRYLVQAAADPAAGGVVTGGGIYSHGAAVAVTATASSGYTFTHWTEGGQPVATTALYNFTAASNRTLTAVFTLLPQPLARNDAAGVLEGEAVTIPVLANDRNPADGALIVLTVSQPGHGAVRIDPGGATVHYRADAGVGGLDSFTYTLQDANGLTSTAIVAVVVTILTETDVAPQVAPVDPAVKYTLAFTSSQATVTAELPAGVYTGVLALPQIFFLSYTPVVTPTAPTQTPPGTLRFGNFEFELTAYLDDQPLHGIVYGQPIVLKIRYNPALLRDIDPATLGLFTWAGGAWSTDGITLVNHDIASGVLTVALSRPGDFAFFGAAAPTDLDPAPEPELLPERLFLPAVACDAAGAGSQGSSVDALAGEPGTWAIGSKPAMLEAPPPQLFLPLVAR